MSSPIVEVDDVAEQLHKVSEADYPALQAHLDAAIQIITDMCLPVQPATITDYLDGGQPTVITSVYPINTVTSVNTYDATGPTAILPAGGTTGVVDGYRLNPSAGALLRVGQSGWPFGFGNVQVTYTVGPTVVPANVVRAVIVLTEHFWQFRKISGGPNQPNVTGNDTMGYTASQEIPGQVYELLLDWLKPPRIA